MPDPAVLASAVIAAAGSGERLGAGGPKAFAPLAGRAMVEWSLDAFRAAASVGPVVLVLPADRPRGQGAELGGLGDGEVVAGGASRSESVAAGLARVDTDLVVIHDAARPLVTPALVDAVVEDLLAHPEAAGVVAAAPVTDTVKVAGDDRVVAETPDRDRLWAVQTPQAFRTAALREALDAPPAVLAAATDDAVLVEARGGTVLVCRAPAENLKVTGALDLRVAELVLADRG